MLTKCFRRFIPFILLTYLLSMHSVYAAAPNYPQISASSGILVDSLRGQVLFEKNSTQKLRISIASKIMTMLLAIEKSKLDTKVTISKESIETEGSMVNLEVGEKYAIEDLLYATMLTTANDAANAIAESIAGDMNKFVELMNEKAKFLDMKNTHFANPSGLENENQFTTAQDLAILLRHALSNSVFNDVFSTSARPWTSKAGSQILVNQNKLFWWGYEGVDGGKVGYGENSLQSAITTVKRENQKLICIVLEAKQDAVFNDSIKVLDYGFENFRKGTLVSKGKILRTIHVGDHELELASMEDVYYTFPVGDSYIKNLEFNVIQDLQPPITQDLILGTARYTLNDGTLIDVNLYSNNEIRPPTKLINIMRDRLIENRDIFYILIVLSIIEVLIILAHLGRFIKKRVFR